MNYCEKNRLNGFSLLELVIAMTITLTLLGIASTILTGAFGILKGESQRTKALVSAQMAIGLMSREIANSGFGLKGNGIVLVDSNKQVLHFRANIKNNNSTTNDPGEDIIYFYDSAARSVIRFDPYDSSQTSAICNKINSLSFQYLNISNSGTTSGDIPTLNTSRIRIAINFTIERGNGQNEDQNMTLITDVALRNSDFLLSHN